MRRALVTSLTKSRKTARTRRKQDKTETKHTRKITHAEPPVGQRGENTSSQGYGTKWTLPATSGSPDTDRQPTRQGQPMWQTGRDATTGRVKMEGGTEQQTLKLNTGDTEIAVTGKTWKTMESVRNIQMKLSRKFSRAHIIKIASGSTIQTERTCEQSKMT